MKLPGLVIFTVSALFCSLSAFEDLGNIGTARKTHSEIFIPGSVHEIPIRNKLCYVFSGQSEQFFSGDLAEPESELYEEAVLSAKNNFYEKLSDGDKTTKITMSQCSVLYRFNDKKIYTVILFIPKDNVTISKKPKTSAKPQPTSPSPSSKRIQEKKSAAATETKKPTDSPANIEKSTSDAKSAPVNNPQSAPQITPGRKERYLARLRKKPDDLYLNYNLAKIYEREEDYIQAEKYYRTAAVLASNDSYFDKATKIDIILATARICETVQKYNLALKYYYLLLKLECPYEIRKMATQKISQIRLKTLE